MTDGERLALELLGEELAARGHEVALVAPGGYRKPWLEVRNPANEFLIETIVANANGYWWPWAERIAALDQVHGAAAVIARVLAASG